MPHFKTKCMATST